MEREEHVIFCAFYIDDGVFASTSMGLLERIFKQISMRLECTALEELSTMLGMQFEYDGEQRCFWLSQSQYIRMIAKKFLGDPDAPERKAHEGKSVPCSPSILELELLDPQSEEVAKHQPDYRSMVGSLNWVAMNGRPDIALGVSILSRGGLGLGLELG